MSRLWCCHKQMWRPNVHWVYAWSDMTGTGCVSGLNPSAQSSLCSAHGLPRGLPPLHLLPGCTRAPCFFEIRDKPKVWKAATRMTWAACSVWILTMSLSMKNVGAVYNPYSVMNAIQYREFSSYWSQTSAANNLMDFIKWDMDGLRQAVIELMGGVELEIDTGGYDNDFVYTTRDAALTMFVHLGYLAYDQDAHTVRIPNKEIRLEFARALRQSDNAETVKRVQDSVRLIMDTIKKNSEAVAKGIKAAHMESSNPMNRNHESSLRAAIQVAYFAYKDYYVKPEELPMGNGYADIVYLPEKGLDIPILLVELKWNQDADTAIRQIREKRYVNSIEGFGGHVLLAGVNYDRKTGNNTCRMEETVVQETIRAANR